MKFAIYQGGAIVMISDTDKPDKNSPYHGRLLSIVNEKLAKEYALQRMLVSAVPQNK